VGRVIHTSGCDSPTLGIVPPNHKPLNKETFMKTFVTQLSVVISILLIGACNSKSEDDEKKIDIIPQESTLIPYQLHKDTKKIEILETSTNAAMPSGPGITAENREALAEANCPYTIRKGSYSYEADTNGNIVSIAGLDLTPGGSKPETILTFAPDITVGEITVSSAGKNQGNNYEDVVSSQIFLSSQNSDGAYYLVIGLGNSATTDPKPSINVMCVFISR
jgi:hypothetical protein